MKTLLVATDFSPAASNAADYAAAMAQSIGADIVLLNTYDIPVSYMEIPVAANFEALQKDAEMELNKLKDDLNKKTGGKLSISTIAIQAVFLDGLKNVCEKLQPYAVIMGSQGTTAAEHLFFGSHTVSAMKHLDWPLITVPKESKFSAVKKIGLACDFMNVTDTIPIGEIKLLLKDFNAELHVLNIGTEEKFDPEIVFQSGLLEEMLFPIKVSYHFINDHDTDTGIINFVVNNNIDLLIALPKRHALLERLIHKSHTRQFIMHSHVPVMILHQ
ncbi:universal stress protein [Ferruginibacter profundus]